MPEFYEEKGRLLFPLWWLIAAICHLIKHPTPDLRLFLYLTAFLWGTGYWAIPKIARSRNRQKKEPGNAETLKSVLARWETIWLLICSLLLTGFVLLDKLLHPEGTWNPGHSFVLAIGLLGIAWCCLSIVLQRKKNKSTSTKSN